MPESAFLDTSTQIARHFEQKGIRTAIEKELAGRELHCSAYVLQEYKRTLVNSCVALHNLLLKSKDLNEALERSEYFQQNQVSLVALSERVRRRIGLIARRYQKQYGDDRATLLRRFSRLALTDWKNLFSERIAKPLIDGTHCCRTKSEPELMDCGAIRPIKEECNRSNPRPCQIDAFWATHAKSLKAISEHLPSDTNNVDLQELNRIKAAAKAVLSGEGGHGKRCTAELSDVIIALEALGAPPPVAIHSTNLKHFKTIGAAVGVDIIETDAKPDFERPEEQKP